MSKRAARIASAVFVAILAGAPFTAILHAAADAAENCRTEPGGQTPEGKHWYYRIEHPSNRQCWYLRGEGERPAQAGETQRSENENPVEPKAEAPAPQRSLADAHAELSSPQPRTEQNTNAGIPQRRQAMPADAAGAPAEQRPNVLESTTRGSLIGTHWPDPSSVNSTLSPQPAPPQTVAEAQPDQATTPVQAAPPAAPVAADTSSAKPTGSLQTLLMVVAGALALAGLTASAIIRFGRRRKAPSIDRARRRVVWEAADSARESSPRQSSPRQPPPRQSSPRQPPSRQPSSRQSPSQTPPWVDPEYARRPGFSPSRHQPDDHNERLDRISEFLERMSKQPSN